MPRFTVSVVVLLCTLTLEASAQRGEVSRTDGCSTVSSGDAAGEGSSAPVSPALKPELPSAPVPFQPLTPKQKLQVVLHRSYSPATFLGAVWGAGLSQAYGDWPQYGGGMQGYGKRLGATVANTEARSFLQNFAAASILHQDPRYFHSTKKGLIQRAWYASTRVVVTYNDQGQHTFNSSELAGALLTASLQNAYYPRADRGLGHTMVRLGNSYTSDMTSLLLREFWPDMRRKFRKHEPERVKRIEDKVEQSKPVRTLEGQGKL